LKQKTLCLLLVLGFSTTAFAQKDRTSWANLNALQPGQKIQVSSLKKQVGTFVNFSDAAISFRDQSGEQSIPKPDVRTVRLMDHKHRLRNTLIVMGVGAGAGAAIGAALHKGCSNQSFCLDVGGAALPAGVGAVLGGVGGAAVGFFLPSHSTIYDVSPH
jgi:hypothetical protein